jgi:hypothetical protein
MLIPLGFEISTGAKVSIPLRHTAITGQTQESGKTTTLEAMIARSGLRAVAFVTKRGEASFASGRSIQPYFTEAVEGQPLWQFVEAILEATLREKMKFQRAWIMKVCRAYDSRDGKWKAPNTLEEVAANVELALPKARGLNESVYQELSEYLRIVIPQIQTLPKTETLDLTPGINVMHLTEYTPEMQALVIRSVIEWVHIHESKTVTIIPEAWKFIPQERQSPVRLACERLIREGAAIENYVWLDSQDLAGVNKVILRNVAVWILGVQREHNEAERTLDHIPASIRKPKLEAIMTLGKGQFFVCHGDQLKKTYVWPVWLSQDAACLVAMTGQAPPPRPAHLQSEDDMWKEECLGLRDKIKDKDQIIIALERRIKDLTTVQRNLTSGDSETSTDPKPSLPTSMPASSNELKNPERTAGQLTDRGTWEEFYRWFLRRAKNDPTVLAILATQPEIQVSVRPCTIEFADSSLRGRVALLIADGFFNEGATGYQVWQELGRRGVGSAKPNVYTACADLCSMGFLTKEKNGDATNYKRVEGLKVTKKEIST